MDDQNMQPMPLQDRVKSARALVKNTFEQIMLKTGVPPYMMDLIICEALADIRKYEIHWRDESEMPPNPQESGDDNAVH